MSDQPEYVVVDIGGTRMRAARSGPEGLRGEPVVQANDDFPDILSALEATGQLSPRPDAICLAVAGPVGTGPDGAWIAMTNRDWALTEQEVTARLPGTDVLFLNDLQAIGHALDDPGPMDIVRPGTPRPGAPRLVVNAGTGVNAAVHIATPAGPVVPASESGFLTLDFTGMEDWHRCVLEDHGSAFADITLSGRGMVSALRSLTGARRRAEEITEAAGRGDPDARAALTLYWRMMGRFCCDLLLVHMATGGLYFHGSAAMAALGAFDAAAFEEAFTGSGPYSGLLQRIPVHAMRDGLCPLRGAGAALTARQATRIAMS